MKEFEQFVRLSKYAGERFDLVQAAGGNVSVNLNNGLMLIKESGCSLSEVDFDKGYIKLETQKVVKILKNNILATLKNKEKKDDLARKLLRGVLRDSRTIPSIEIFLHVLLYRTTLHVHPLAINAIGCRTDSKAIFKQLFFGRIPIVDYETPGIELALVLQKVIKRYEVKHGEKPKVIFLKNHGLIVSADDVAECIVLLEGVLERAEEYLGIDLKKYKLTNRISALVNSLDNTHYVSYLSCDDQLNDFLKKKKSLFFKKACCPDGVVYCQKAPLEITSLKDKEPFMDYLQKYSQLPRIIIYKGHLFFVGQSIKKAREIEDVLKSTLLILNLTKNKENFLDRREVDYLMDWKAEEYRREKD